MLHTCLNWTGSGTHAMPRSNLLASWIGKCVRLQMYRNGQMYVTMSGFNWPARWCFKSLWEIPTNHKIFKLETNLYPWPDWDIVCLWGEKQSDKFSCTSFSSSRTNRAVGENTQNNLICHSVVETWAQWAPSPKICGVYYCGCMVS